MNNTKEFKNLLHELSTIKDSTELKNELPILEKTYDIDNMDSLLQAILKVNKTVLKTYFNQEKLTTTNNMIDNQSEFSIEDVQKIFKNGTVESIKNEYTKNEITNMYRTVLNTNPSTKNKKEYTIRALYNYYNSIKRAESIAKVFRSGSNE